MGFDGGELPRVATASQPNFEISDHTQTCAVCILNIFVGNSITINHRAMQTEEVHSTDTNIEACTGVTRGLPCGLPTYRVTAVENLQALVKPTSLPLGILESRYYLIIALLQAWQDSTPKSLPFAAPPQHEQEMAVYFATHLCCVGSLRRMRQLQQDQRRQNGKRKQKRIRQQQRDLQRWQQQRQEQPPVLVSQSIGCPTDVYKATVQNLVGMAYKSSRIYLAESDQDAAAGRL